MSDALRALAYGFGTAAASPAFLLAAAFTIASIVVYHFGVARRRTREALMRSAGASSNPHMPDVSQLRDRVAALESAAAGALQYVGFVRFNAFPDVASELSYALAVVDGRGDGFVLSSLYSREEVRTYAKSVNGFGTDKELSAEERRALGIARERARPTR